MLYQCACKKAKQLGSLAEIPRGSKAEELLLCVLCFCLLYFLFFLPSITACAAASLAMGTR